MSCVRRARSAAVLRPPRSRFSSTMRFTSSAVNVYLKAHEPHLSIIVFVCDCKLVKCRNNQNFVFLNKKPSSYPTAMPQSVRLGIDEACPRFGDVLVGEVGPVRLVLLLLP